MINYTWLVLVLTLLFSFKVKANPRLSFAENLPNQDYAFDFRYSLFETRSIYDENQNSVALKEGESYRIQNWDLLGRYSYSRNLQFGVGIRFRYVNSIQLGPLDSELRSLDEAGIHSTHVNVAYAFDRVDSFLYKIEFDYRHFNYTNRVYNQSNPNDFIVMGNDGGELNLGLAVTYKPIDWLSYFSLAGYYRQPGSNVSDEILYRLEGNLGFKRFALFAGAEGVVSLNNDEFGENNNNRPSLATGPSRFFDGVNREYLNAYIGFNWQVFNHWKMELIGAQTLQGKNTDKMDIFMFNLIYHQPKNVAYAQYKDSFKMYSIEGEITKISPKNNYAVISVGLADGVSAGMKFDLYKDNFLGGNELIASAVVVKVSASSSIIKIMSQFKSGLKEGLTARGGMR
jgi:hypothetical protein